MQPVDEYYSDIAGGYDELYREEQLEKARSIIYMLKEKHIKIGGVILDVGAGTGVSSELFVNAGCRCILLEPSKKMLALCTLNNTIRLAGSAEKIPLPNNSCDGVVSITALHHTDIAKALKEIERVCKKKGWIAVSLLKKNADEYECLFEGYERYDLGKDDVFFKRKN